MKLREIAYSRSGDKGDTSNICVFVYDPADYPRLVEALTADVVRERFGSLVHGHVDRYEMPRSHGLNFVLTRALGGRGVDERACRSARQVVPDRWSSTSTCDQPSEVGSLLTGSCRRERSIRRCTGCRSTGRRRSWTYGELVHDVFRLAAELQRRGLVRRRPGR